MTETAMTTTRRERPPGPVPTPETATLSHEERHRILFERSHDALMTLAPPDWRFTSGNATTLAMFGPAFIHVDGTAQYGGSPSGSYQLDVQTRSIAALDQACDPELQSSRCEAGLRCAASLCQIDSKILACTEAQPSLTGVDQSFRTHAFMADHFQVLLAQQMHDVVLAAGKEVVHAKYAVPLTDQALAQV